MRVDVLALQRFYASPLGDAARRMASRRLAALWPHADGLDVLGLGYATPFLERFRGNARRVVAMMPMEQGAEAWPPGTASLSALAEEGRLPFMDAIFDRVLIVHTLEETDTVRPLLREVWRVMAPEGRLLVIAANRWSLWAQADETPFGHGRPYSRMQLAELLADSMFEPVASARALVGEMTWPALGGLVLMEAVKRLYADTSRSEGRVLLAKAPVRNRGGVPETAPGPLPQREP